MNKEKSDVKGAYTIPPPPPMSKKPSTIKNDVVKHLKHLQETQDYDTNTWLLECKNLMCKLTVAPKGINKESLTYFYTKHSNICPVVQDGPQCGLVALCMAADMLGITTDISIVFERAKSMNFTLQGEMFSVEAMLKLGKVALGCNGEIVKDSTIKEKIVKSIIGGKPVLVPYDKDRNHEPCLKEGIRAHWAVATGILFRSSKVLHNSSIKQEIKQDTDWKNLYILPAESCESHLKSYDVSELKDIYIYAQQGKSLRTHLWSLDYLLESNSQLRIIDPKVLGNVQDYIIPEGGIEKGLRGKVVLLYT